MNPFGLSEPSIAIIKSIFSKYEEVSEVILYGSRAKGNFQERSDVDLVICKSKIDRHVLGKIILDINNSNFPYTIDIQLFEDLKNIELINHINRVGQSFYKKEN
ncbi:MAG: nucleotidyltransferase domain-containing protein [Sphingobacteriia bacterium]|nr:nucleotidyltransferase domain-containing protein [Sphingobacteriia bacterium]